MERLLFTSESVTEGHPDKMCDQISDAILDALMEQDPMSRVACETCATTGIVMVMGEITTNAYVDIQKIVRDTVREIGYTRGKYGFDADTCGVLTAIDEQSSDIAMGVDKALEAKEHKMSDEELEAIGAGDQGMMFGYASDETEEYMPYPIALAHKLARRLTEVRKNGTLPYLRPDGKTQVTVEYDENGVPARLDAVVLSTQHDPDVSQEQIHEDVKKYIFDEILPADMVDENTKFFINPTGRFVIGGPHGDSGLTGRKIIVDTYGGMARHGGGAFSGKDCTKVDRSAAYAARYVAKNIVAAGIAKKCEIQQFIISACIAVVLILTFTAMIMMVWIYGSIISPIHKLQEAAQNVEEGNLNFEIKPEKDDEMGRLMQAFEKMRIRLRDNAEEKLKSDRESKELISNISHDLKTPITAIKGYVEGIRDGVADTPEKMEKYIGTIYNKANEMDTLINELTLYAKIDTNRIPYNFAPLSVNDYFNDCAEDIEMELDSKNVEFGYFNYVEGDQKIIADPEQLKRVINNIVSNSLKYMEREHGLINLRVKDVGDFIQVELEDNGKGIAAKDLPNIFDRFYRTDASRNSSKGGSGIGLSIVKKIIEDHGGKIWATSREGVGTVMYFVIRKYQEVPINE